jgi:hypothetical protein
MQKIRWFIKTNGYQVLIIFFLAVAGVIGFLTQWWLKKENMNISSSTLLLYSFIAGVGSGIFGYLANNMATKQKDQNLSTSEMLEKISKNLAINPIHKKRLLALAREAFESWRQILVVPNEGWKLRETFFAENTRLSQQFTRIEPLSSPSATACPVVNTEPILYFNTYKISNGETVALSKDKIISLLNEELMRVEEKVPQSIKLFKVLSKDLSKDKVRIWIKTPNYIVRSNNDIEDLLNAMTGCFKELFYNFQITLELYVAKDITKDKVEITISPVD